MSFLARYSGPLSFGAVDDNPPALNLAPFVDIVLQLICFYIFVGGAVQRYSDPLVLLPRITHPDAPRKQPSEIVMNIRDDGSLLVNDQPMSLKELGPLLVSRRHHQETDATAPPVRATVRVDRRQRYGALEDVLRICREAGLAHIMLATTEEHPP